MTTKTSSKTSKDEKQSNQQQSITTRKNEVRYFTSDPKKMLNMWLASRVLKTWTEDFKDEDTCEVVSIERTEVLFDKGKFIDQDTLQKIQFSMKADGIKEVEVSNQNRQGYEVENESMYPYTVKAIQGTEKSKKYLLLASSIEKATDITRDYLETHSQYGFWITTVQQLDRCTIINDPKLYEDVIDDNNDNDDPVYDEDGKEIKPEEKKVKFYQIDINIKTQQDIAIESPGDNDTYIVQTYSAEDAMVLIKGNLEEYEDQRIERVKEQAETNGRKPTDEDLERRHFILSTLKLVPLPIYDMIPRELSESYN